MFIPANISLCQALGSGDRAVINTNKAPTHRAAIWKARKDTVNMPIY